MQPATKNKVIVSDQWTNIVDPLTLPQIHRLIVLTAREAIRALAARDGEWDCTTQDARRMLFVRHLYLTKRINEGVMA